MKLQQILTYMLVILGLLFLLCLGLIIMMTPAHAVDVPDQPVKVEVVNPAPVNVTTKQQQKQQQQMQQQQSVQSDNRSYSISGASVSGTGDTVSVSIGPLGLSIPTGATTLNKRVTMAGVAGLPAINLVCRKGWAKRAYPARCGGRVNRAAITDQRWTGGGKGAKVSYRNNIAKSRVITKGGDK